MGEIRARFDSDGKAALYALREFATLGTLDDATDNEAVKFAARFLREVDPHERERVLAVLRRPRISVPGR
ncbi:MAG: hypothetical protein ACRDWE_07475 [Acidimicrobiales bacterium]